MTELKDAIKKAVAKQKEELRQKTSVEIEKGRIVIDMGVELSDEEKELIKVEIEQRVSDIIKRLRRA